LNFDLGIIINPAAEKIAVVDENGQPLDSQMFLLLITDLYLRTNKCKKIAVPVAASMGVEEIARQYGVEVIRVGSDHLSMMEIFRRGDVDFVGGTRGGIIIPGFQMASDAMFTTVKTLEMMAKTKTTFGDLRKKYEHYIRKEAFVPCPWSKKGTVMRQLIINSAEKDRQLIDGVRIFEDNGWVLLTPDRITASFKISAESNSVNDTDSLISKYTSIVNQYQTD
jgi:mannose-1-phosphate guanylyltransferase/phosphomannomutase